MNRKPTQAQRVLEYMIKHGSITQLDCYQRKEFYRDPVLRLSARIFELRENGHEITSESKTKKKNGETKQWVEYKLVKYAS